MIKGGRFRFTPFLGSSLKTASKFAPQKIPPRGAFFNAGFWAFFEKTTNIILTYPNLIQLRNGVLGAFFKKCSLRGIFRGAFLGHFSKAIPKSHF